MKSRGNCGIFASDCRALTDQHHSERGAGHHPKRGIRQGVDTFGVRVGAVYPAEKAADGGYPSACSVGLGDGSRPLEDDAFALRRAWATRENEGAHEPPGRYALCRQVYLVAYCVSWSNDCPKGSLE